MQSTNDHSCHLTACYGVAEGIPLQHWLCDLCEREKVKDRLVSVSALFLFLHLSVLMRSSPCSNLHAFSALLRSQTEIFLVLSPLSICSNRQKWDSTSPARFCSSSIPPDSFPFFYSYIHLLCAVYHPELKFTEPSRLEIVEGFASLPQRRAKEVSHNFSSSVSSNAHQTRSISLVLYVSKKEQELRFLVLVAAFTSTSRVPGLRTTSSRSRYKYPKSARRNRRKLLKFDSRKKKVSFSFPLFPLPPCLSELLRKGLLYLDRCSHSLYLVSRSLHLSYGSQSKVPRPRSERSRSQNRSFPSSLPPLLQLVTLCSQSLD